MVSTTFSSGFGADPISSSGTPSVGFLSVSPTVTITSGQKIIVDASKALGSVAAGGASGLNLWVCYQSTAAGSSIVAIGGGILGLQVPQNTRITFAINGVITGLAAGSYQVGMCGQASAAQVANWKYNEYSYVTAIVTN
ncbi:MAG: hypothetical protein AMXMBFR64_63120 [Myxococcales bacterium]